MRNNIEPPVYSKIALDVAARIARGELKEGTRISGRSLLAGEYKVSPETIRRSMRLLSDVEIVEIQPNSGAVIISRVNAIKYVDRYNVGKDLRTLKFEIKDLLADRQKLDSEILDRVEKMFDLSERLKNTNPLNALEFEITQGSPIVGETIADTNFWQNTSATIVGIKREGTIIISPGPYACFMENDILLVVGDVNTISRVTDFISNGINS